MSKITITLLIILILVVGFLLFVAYGEKQNPIITSLTKPIIARLKPAHASLSFSTSTQTVTPAQTITVAVLIHNQDPEPGVAQLEIGYDPNAVTIESITPGAFFTKPIIALENIDPVAGRISYALRCPASQSSYDQSSCVNPSSSTLATITMQVNPYAVQDTTSLSFFPKTVLRTLNGFDFTVKTSGLQIMLNKLYAPTPTSSSSAIYHSTLQVTPIH